MVTQSGIRNTIIIHTHIKNKTKTKQTKKEKQKHTLKDLPNGQNIQDQTKLILPDKARKQIADCS